MKERPSNILTPAERAFIFELLDKLKQEPTRLYFVTFRKDDGEFISNRIESYMATDWNDAAAQASFDKSTDEEIVSVTVE